MFKFDLVEGKIIRDGSVFALMTYSSALQSNDYVLRVIQNISSCSSVSTNATKHKFNEYRGNVIAILCAKIHTYCINEHFVKLSTGRAQKGHVDVFRYAS